MVLLNQRWGVNLLAPVQPQLHRTFELHANVRTASFSFISGLKLSWSQLALALAHIQDLLAATLAVFPSKTQTGMFHLCIVKGPIRDGVMSSEAVMVLSQEVLVISALS